MKTMRAVLVLFVATMAATGFASGLPVVPAGVQLAVFQNVWRLDRNFHPPVKMAILYQEHHHASVTAKNDVLAAIASAKLPIQCVVLEAGTPDLLTKVMTETDANVIYVTPLRAVDIGSIAAISRRRDIRTITGIPEYVDAGISVGIGMRKNRPLIIVNLAAARAEGADYTAQLLGLARIVGPIQ
ncbi:MAG TPA: YfiR family protein [Thermoanaerobaculia bacterium]|jgi:hypothetical protein|nr:YfiR family protein [Thermoanaerobaculia bacterium]